MIYIRYFPGSNLGNWLFQYAHAKQLSPDGKVAFYVTDDVGKQKLARFQRIYSDAPIVDVLPDPCPMVYQWNEHEWRTKGFPLNGDYLIDGYFQDVALLDEAFVADKLKCPEDIRHHLFLKYSTLRSGKPLVGISVRRGDYMRIPHLLPFVGNDYLTRAVEQFPNDVCYVVCSDDLHWCKRFFVEKRFGKRQFLFIESEDVLSQLYIHTFCDHNIISNSTFSWWGAYLGYLRRKAVGHCGRVIFPSMWFGCGEGYAFPKGLYWHGVEIVGNGYSLSVHLAACIKDQRSRFRHWVGGMTRKMHLR